MKKRWIGFSVLLIIAFAYNNCGLINGKNQMGTEIGNPFSGPSTGSPVSIPNPNPSPSPTPAPSAASKQSVLSSQVVSGACSVLVRCNPKLNITDCQGAMGTAAGVVQALGLASPTYSNLNAVQAAEAQGILSAKAVSLESCLKAVAALRCTDPSVVSSYVSTSPEPFQNVSNILSSQLKSCASLF